MEEEAKRSATVRVYMTLNIELGYVYSHFPSQIRAQDDRQMSNMHNWENYLLKDALGW